jgi:sulfate transport system substrate-binding protein
MKFKIHKWPRLLALGAVGTTVVASFALPASASNNPNNVNVVGYSVVGPAIKAAESAFQATPAGQGVTFTNSIGASGTEATAVANGLPADVVNLSYYSDEQGLVAKGDIPSNWSSQEDTIAGVNPALTGTSAVTTYSTPGIVTDSTVVFIVRAGNPLGIKNWGQLTASDVQIVTPNPATSGSAKWNLLAAYAAWIATGHTAKQSQNFLKSVIQHTVAQPPSGSTALSTFLAGTGNVLLDYEDDAIAAQNAGDKITVVVPPQTLLIENPIALTNTGLNKPAAVAFYKYLFSPGGQGIFAYLGYRSVLKSVWTQTEFKFAPFKKPTDLQTVESLNAGGWPVLDPEFFSTTVAFPNGSTTYPNQGIVTYLEQFAGQDS